MGVWNQTEIDSKSSTWMMFNTDRTNHCVTRKA